MASLDHTSILPRSLNLGHIPDPVIKASTNSPVLGTRNEPLKLVGEMGRACTAARKLDGQNDITTTPEE